MKLKPLASLICVALAAGTMVGCGDVYDKPDTPATETPGNPETPGTPDTPIDPGSIIPVDNLTDLITKINSANTGDVIGLVNTGNFEASNVKNNELVIISIEKGITLTSITEDHELSELDKDQAVISGQVCIDIASEADGEKTTISNIAFENIILPSDQTCGSDVKSRSVINVGKVGNGSVPAVLSHLTFDGSGFTETSGEGAWIYSRGLANVTNSHFTNKLEDNTGFAILEYNCGSNRVSGGSGNPTGPQVTGNTFSLVSQSNQVNGVVAGSFQAADENVTEDKKNDRSCRVNIDGNHFENFENEVTATSDGPKAAIIDGDVILGNTIGTNTFGDKAVTPDPDVGDDPIALLNAEIEKAEAGTRIFLSADEDYSEGIIYLNKAVILDGNENSASITGSACINVSAPGAEIQNLNFNNTSITQCDSGETSQSRSGAITIMKTVGSDSKDLPVLLTGLHFDAAGIKDADSLTNAASLIYSGGYFKLSDSKFDNLPSTFKSPTVYTPCNTAAARRGNELDGNTFTLVSGGNAEINAVKVGGSGGGIIDNTRTNCDVTLTSNTFNNYGDNTITEQVSADDSGNRVTAVFARKEALNSDAETVNTFNK